MVDHLLADRDVLLPDSITSQKDEVIFFFSGKLDNFRKRSNGLLVVGSIRKMFEVEVAQRS